jgi:hypothetical protein
MENAWSEHLSANCLGSFRTVCASGGSPSTFRASLETQGFRAYVLDSAGVDNKLALLAALAECFGINDYADSALSSWDAASDVIWQALMERSDQRVAILWHHADVMIANQLQLFLHGLEILYALGDTLERQEVTTDTHPVLLRIVIESKSSTTDTTRS